MALVDEHARAHVDPGCDPQHAADILADQLPSVPGALAAPRSMRWSAGPNYVASRALRWVVALLGDAVVPFSCADVTSGRTVRVRRNADPLEVEVASADQHLDMLRAQSVD